MDEIGKHLFKSKKLHNIFKLIAVPFRMAPRVIITKFPAEHANEDSIDQTQKNSNDDSKDRIHTKRKYLCLVFDMHCQLKAKLRKLDQLRLKVQGQPKNPPPMSRPHQPQPYFTKDEMYGMNSMHWNAFHGM